jgi:hypothetical protein
MGGSRAFDGEGWRTPTGYGGSPSLALAATLTEIFARSKRGRPWYKLTAPMMLKGKRMGRRSRPRPHGGSILRRI